MINSEPLPWVDWAAEFRDKMPREIADLIKEFATDGATDDFSKSIHERLKQILDLYKVSRYKPSPEGALTIDMDALVRGGTPRPGDYESTGSGRTRSGNKDGAAGGAYSAYLKEGGTRGEQVDPDPFPDVTWVTVEDGSRTPPDRVNIRRQIQESGDQKKEQQGRRRRRRQVSEHGLFG